MPPDPKKRQKKKEKQTAKRKAKHQQLARAKSAGLPQQLAGASRYPILHAWVSDTVWKQGLGYVCLSRELPGQQVAFVLFLVDRYCLGVKDAIVRVDGRFTYDSRITRGMRGKSPAHDVTPACARKLVEGAVAYAREFGLHPHPDYQSAKLIFGDINAGECTEEFEYGKDGKPFFVAGPYDTPARCRAILAALERSRGPGGFHYLIPVGPDKEIRGIDDWEPEDELEEENESGGSA